MFLTIQGLISGSQDFLAGKDEALKAAFQRMQATCKTFGKAPMFHWMTSQLARVSGNIDMAIEEVTLAKEGFADFESEKYELFRIRKEIAWCHYIKGGDWELVASATEGPAKKDDHLMRAWTCTLAGCAYGMLENREKYKEMFKIFENEGEGMLRTELDKVLAKHAAVAVDREDCRLAAIEVLYLFNQMNSQKPPSWFKQWFPVLGEFPEETALKGPEDAVRTFLRSVAYCGLKDDEKAQKGYKSIVEAYETESKFGSMYVVPNSYFLIAEYECRMEHYKEADDLCKKAKAFSGFLFQKNFSMKVKALQDYVARNLKKAVVDTGDLDDY